MNKIHDFCRDAIEFRAEEIFTTGHAVNHRSTLLPLADRSIPEIAQFCLSFARDIQSQTQAEKTAKNIVMDAETSIRVPWRCHVRPSSWE
jgi:hypothetical protein